MSTSRMDEFTNFSGQTVVVTGASGVIGEGIASRFAEAGAHVFIHYRSGEEGARSLQAAIREAGGRADMVAADLRRKADIEAMFEQVDKETGLINVLVNNAGIYPLSALADITEEEWDEVLNANLRSTFLCTQAVVKYMQKAGGGSIVNISSIESEHATPMHSHYCAAKSGVNMFTRTTANELGRYNIRCNAVLPGLIWREGIEEQWPEGVEAWQKAAPLSRLGRAMDVANACLFLSSSAAGWISGAELRVDGGVTSNRAF